MGAAVLVWAEESQGLEAAGNTMPLRANTQAPSSYFSS